jgi:hypothetical protein
VVGSDLEDLQVPAGDTRVRRGQREPSSSPPPVVQQPPAVEEMRGGYGGDDGWMMVEDEFYSTAQQFTAHVHHAEYARLKRLHRSRGVETLRALERGTDGRTGMSREVEFKRKVEEKRRGGGGGESEEEDEWMDDPQLAVLMGGGQKEKRRDLTRVAEERAARVSESPWRAVKTRDAIADERDAVEDDEGEDEDEDEEEETDEDDLDAPRRAAEKAAEHIRIPGFKGRGGGFFERFAQPTPSSPLPPSPPSIRSPVRGWSTRMSAARVPPSPSSPRRVHPSYRDKVKSKPIRERERFPSPPTTRENVKDSNRFAPPPQKGVAGMKEVKPVSFDAPQPQRHVSRTSQILAKRKATVERAEKEIKDEDTIPTFLF